ncbi:helix-turn-helix transcriptional regulator [Providencia stuartii]|uniref:helix-turn-helix domain-containing protein n=1 Tax=Providencia TaxID=586 RepID=UPI0027EF2F18|nr:helix-turn-helix transcriptional regulator [Providencia sp. 2023EL-00965]ELR5300046.1 helix-turn-helix transcriptional regulator [Providencia stuartii]MDW7589124.1 helix-turn-helix transcriptional regulator [Providencia sp. 2023EL-00965]
MDKHVYCEYFNVIGDGENLYKNLTSKQQLSLIIGRQIYFIRKARCMTGKQLGEQLNVSQQQISRYENGVCHIDVDTLIRLLYILDMPIDQFFSQVSVRLSQQFPATYAKYHSLFIPVVDASNNEYRLIKSKG